MSPTMQMILMAIVAVQVDADECLTLIGQMGGANEPKSASGEKCEAANMCEKGCLGPAQEVLAVCDGHAIPDIQKAMDQLKIDLAPCPPPCDDALYAGMAEWKTAGGERCIPDDNTMQTMDNICDSNCMQKTEGFIQACSETEKEPHKGMAEMFGHMVPTCTDPCLKSFMVTMLNECDLDDVGGLTGVCKEKACDIPGVCSATPSSNPELKGMIDSMIPKINNGCAATSSGTRTVLSGLAAALLFSAVGLH
eukprot:gnl/TRDRNA2_/TRDRNA2_131014_c0_seq1.p1 gnl/TRDRNA2_/TRDRNA2_131014_c0~~gnl/TRDRNA2_/TRDRNA2_131014_c0_seq1.p1  ORF type:complete len:251 (+),score=40.53 gnl/TRDRNA2_/TRDRNA2_131014_c0_seq1:88-840(+)